ncbi:hypothetical protein KAK07_22430 [Ideonella sp. 4Y16]|uniref:hypothetical protein n=1 Tax=Ideonella alba TaxID=2824118 RepID=UPI001B3953A9|nr:hypothetical protein [Ideonella alba]MBQ0946117.1 hypothetical protein [Ideonella alba]
MKQSLHVLGTLDVGHAFFAEPPGGLMRFLLPPSSAALLGGGQALARELRGLWALLAEQHDDDPPPGPLHGRTLLLGLQPLDPGLDRYTRPPLPAAPAGSPAQRPCWRNSQAPAALDAAPLDVELCGRRPRLQPVSAERPLDWRLLDGAGQPLLSGRLSATQAAPAFSTDLPIGLLRWQERDPASAALLAERWLCIEPALAAAAPWGLVALRLDDAFAQQPAHWQLTLQPREDVLRYYVVGRGWAAPEMASLQVSDATPGLPAPQRLGFTRIDDWSGDPPDSARLPAAMLLGSAPPGAQVVLFEAQRSQTRRSRPEHRLQLQSDQRLLIEHLPQPGAARSDAQFVVHLAP